METQTGTVQVEIILHAWKRKPRTDCGEKNLMSAFTLGYLIHFWPYYTEKYPLLTFNLYQVKNQYLEFVFDKR